MAAITWTNITPVNILVAGTTLTKVAGSEDTQDAVATSTEVLSADGEFTLTVPAQGQIGVGLDPSSSPVAFGAFNYAFNLGENGYMDIREAGVYKAESTYTGGEVFKFVREGSTIKYYRDATLLYTSLVAASGDYYLHLQLADLGDAITNGTVTGGAASTLPEPSAITQTDAPATYTNAITDRTARAKPSALPTPPALGGTYLDELFSQYLIRGTSTATGAGASIGKTHRMPSSAPVSVWSRDSSLLYAVTPTGVVEVFSINTGTDSSTRGRLTYVRDLTFTQEPTWSRVLPRSVYGTTGYKVRRYDHDANTYTDVIDLAVVDPSYTGGALVLGGTVHSSMSDPERIVFFYGGTAQDTHFRCMIFDADNTANRLVLDTQAKTINGIGVTMDAFHLHAATVDMSGRYVLLNSTSADEIADPSGNSIAYVWDTAEATVTELTDSMFGNGHSIMGWQDMVNQDSGNGLTYDATQWQYRTLDDIANPVEVIAVPLTPSMVYMGDHQYWENCRSDVITPFLSIMARYYEDNADNLELLGNRSNTVPYRACDNEIFFVHPITGAWYRLAHHRANVYTDDGSGLGNAFWYQPQGHPSPDGRFVVFSTNFEKTLGLEPGGGAATAYRSDLFVIDTDWVVEGEEEEGGDNDPDSVSGTLLVSADSIKTNITGTTPRLLTESATISKGGTRVNLTIYKGARKNFVGTLSPTTDISGWTIEASVRARNAQGVPTGPVLLTLAGTLTAPVSGVFTIPFTAANTATLNAGLYAWDIWRTDSTNDEIIMPPGTIEILPSVAFL